jgi:hypothetical protein
VYVDDWIRVMVGGVASAKGSGAGKFSGGVCATTVLCR